jgi:hypothetical protein
MHTMKSGLNFLVAARQCEIGELEQLALTSELVSLIARLIHALQKERGLSNVYLASGGARLADARRQQLAECQQVELDVRQRFDELDIAPRQGGHGARLFSRIAWVLHALDALPGVRGQVDILKLSPAEATTWFVRLIAGLLTVVFEAADSAGDPEISRALVAMFNFMQGKEFAGQERAFGSAAFASGRTDSSTRQQWLHLVESQERCLQVFRDYSEPAIVQAWLAGQSGAALLEIERLRRIGCGPDGGALDRNLSHDWFDNCTLRMDALKLVEEQLACGPARPVRAQDRPGPRRAARPAGVSGHPVARQRCRCARGLRPAAGAIHPGHGAGPGPAPASHERRVADRARRA